MKDFNSVGIRHCNNQLQVLDQTRLPREEYWINVTDIEQMYEIIKNLRVRGAPIIGISASLFMAKYTENKQLTVAEFTQIAQHLASSRPTAVQLSMMLGKMTKLYTETQSVTKVTGLALQFYQEDEAAGLQMADAAKDLIKSGSRILTHCNTGCLVGAGIGSGLGIIRAAHESGKNIFVYVDETRPLLQGARLTAWEMQRFNIPFKLICDNFAGHLMAENMIDLVIVGADRIAANGDTANKIGTYSLATLAKYHNIPFYIAAAHTTFDLVTKTGKDIVIEERHASEVTGVVTGFGSFQVADVDCPVYNPAFDVTPCELITAHITNYGVIKQGEDIATRLVGVL